MNPNAKQKLSVLVNARPLGSILTGIARYTRSLYSAISETGATNVSYYSNGQVSRSMPEQAKSIFGRQLPVWLRKIAVQTRHVVDSKAFKRQITNSGFNVYHETGAIPLVTSGELPTVLTIHDLSLITHSQFHPADRVRQFEKYFSKSINSINHIITISYFIRSEIVKHLGISEENITVTPLAADSFFTPQPPDVVNSIKQHFGISGRYVLTVGTKEPRKNLVSLVRAFDRLENNLTLVHAGWSGWLNEELEEALLKLKHRNRIIFLGHVTDEQLAALYSGATMMVYPSYYEGFGLPILESMSCGCPVICSNTSSMPEIASDSAMLVEPSSVDNIRSSILRLADDPTYRDKLSDSGIKRAQDFSWQSTAQKTIDVFSQVAR